MNSNDPQSTMIQRVIRPAAEVEAVAVSEPAFLLVIAGDELGRKFPLTEGEHSIGRSSSNQICVDHSSVSRQHAVVSSDTRGVWIRDNHSTNGTQVNDNPINAVELKAGDLIKVGNAVFKYLTAGTVEEAYHDELYRLSTLDGLTQLYNKRYFHDAIERELAAARRHGRALCLLTFDIDHFKRCNDTYGHLAGDQVLRQLAEVIRHRARATDIAARTGGEEFSVILPDTHLASAAQLAEALRQAVAEEIFQFDGAVIPVTISIGVAEWSAQMLEHDELLHRADTRLYAAKHGGRNRVVAAD